MQEENLIIFQIGKLFLALGTQNSVENAIFSVVFFVWEGSFMVHPNFIDV